MRVLTAFALTAALQASPGAAQAGKLADSAIAAIAAGRTQWLRYDTEAHQIAGCDAIYPSIDAAATYQPDPLILAMILPTDVAMKLVHNAVIACASRTSNTGSASYDRAESSFRAAYAVAPGDGRAFRQLAMLLAEKNRWKELELLGRTQSQRVVSDAWGWLALGLALHRGGSSDRATAIFDTALTRLEPPERARMFAFQRLLSRPDSITYVKGNPAARLATERTLWAMADPLWSRRGRDARTEFLARVTFAELRWTVEEGKVRGADSDRGETYIRYGPPDVIIAMRGRGFSGTAIGDTGRLDALAGSNSRGPYVPRPSDVVTWWDYFNGLSIVFWGAPAYGTASFPQVDGYHVEKAIEERPVAFDNIATEKIIEMPSRVMRFRAPGDSMDVLLIAQAPMNAIRGEATANMPVRADFWLLGREMAGAYRDSLTLRGSGIEQRTYRVAPGAYQYRVEATADGSLVAGRTMGWVAVDSNAATGFMLRGFSTSDLVLASVAQPNTNPPSRWHDFNIAPLLGALPRQRNLELIWENYELGALQGRSQYQVALSLQRQRSATGRVAAAIVGFAADAVGIDRRDDRVTFKFDRTVASAAAIVDHVSIAMAGTPAGEYRITLEVTDKVSGRKTSRTTQLVIGQ